MPARTAFACVLVLGGVVCLVTSVIAGTKLDTAYVGWSSSRMNAEPGQPPASQRSALAGAPLSILSPILIWLSVGVGLALTLIGVLVGLLSKKVEPARERKPRLDDDESF